MRPMENLYGCEASPGAVLVHANVSLSLYSKMINAVHNVPIVSLCSGEGDLLWSNCEGETKLEIRKHGKDPIMQVCHTAVLGLLALAHDYEDCIEDLDTRAAKPAIESMLVSPN